MGPSWLGGGAGAPHPWPLGSVWARASRTSSGLYLMEPPGQVQLIPPEKLHRQISVLTSFSVTLITMRQKLGEATALRDPQVTTPKGKRLDHDGHGRRVRLSSMRAPAVKAQHTTARPCCLTGRDGLGLHAVAESGPLPPTSPKGCQADSCSPFWDRLERLLREASHAPRDSCTIAVTPPAFLQSKETAGLGQRFWAELDAGTPWGSVVAVGGPRAQPGPRKTTYWNQDSPSLLHIPSGGSL